MKKTKGISLIVLVITIIVMIIIAGAIILSLTQTNVIDQAENAVQKHNEASEKDILTLAWGEYMAFSISNPAAELKVEGATVTGDNTNGWTVTFTSGSKYTVSSKGVITKDGVQEELEIDDDKVIQILMGLLSGTIDEEIAATQLKQELHIANANNLMDMMITFTEPINENKQCIYFYSVDRLYFMEYQEVDGEGIINIEYASREKNEIVYQYAAKVEKIRQELDTAFVGKTVTEIQAKHTECILEQYILDNCKSIKTVEIKKEYEEEYIITNMTFDYSDIKDKDFGENTITFIANEEGKYVRVVIGAGS